MTISFSGRASPIFAHATMNEPERLLIARLALPTKNNYAQLLPVWIDFHEQADTRPWHAVLEKILAENPASARDLTRGRFFVSLYERDPVAAERALATLDYPVMNARGVGAVKFSPAYARGLRRSHESRRSRRWPGLQGAEFQLF